jgi:putative SOS response-associated peptidase YedK
MCGRYTLRANLNRILEEFGVEAREGTHVEPPFDAARYNIAPTTRIPIIRQGDSGRELTTARWGLIPSWAKDEKIAYSTINARADGVADKPAFRAAFKRRRCLIPADGYYEWLRDGKEKQPFLYEVGEPGALFAVAGLWEAWHDIESATIITTEANSLASAVHDRMPVILHKGDYDTWLDPTISDRARLEGLLKPYDGPMQARPVSRYVNNARNQGAECVVDPA